jgi:hypothetical protein
MFDISIAEGRQVVLIRFFGRLEESDFAKLDRLAAEARGSNVSLDTIFDMTEVEHVDLAAQFVAARGELPQAYSDRQRFYVVPQEDLKLLVRLYVTYQANLGWRPPRIVATLAEAFTALGVSAADFHRWRSA